MIVVVLWLLMSLGAAVGLADGAARLERASGRDAFRAEQVRVVAAAELARLSSVAWSDSARAVAGPVWPLPPDTVGRVIVTRWLERLPGPGDRWLLAARAESVDRAGRTQAGSLRGLIVQFQVSDSTGFTVPRLVSRPVLPGVQ